MHIDPPSMQIALLATHMLYASLLLGMWLRDRTNDALGLWALADVSATLGIWLIGLRGDVPYALTVSLANVFVIGGWMLVWGGIRRFCERKLPLFTILSLPLLVGLLFQFVPALHQHYPARVAINGLVWDTALVLVIIDCARAERRERLYVRRVLMVAFALLGCFIAFRVWNTLGLPPEEDRMMTGRLAGLMLFVNMLMGAAWNLSLIMMWNERLEKRLRLIANSDALTNVLNRRGFQKLSERLLLRANRDQTPSAVLLMDLDHFKSINDRHGHDTGDRIICLFAEVAARATRPSDLLARYGGEEFCALLTNTTEVQAKAIAERLRSDFAAASIDLDGLSIGTTVSIGVAKVELQEAVDQALNRADAALYLAKKKGRNRVEGLPSLWAELSGSSENVRLQAPERGV